MSKHQTYQFLGPPSGTVPKSLIRTTFSNSSCVESRVEEASYYYLYPKESIVIYSDEAGRVVCKEKRLMAFAVD